MKSVIIVLAFICLASAAQSACSADDVNCEDPITFESESGELYIKKYSPSQSAVNVVLDTTIQLQFSDAVPSSQDFSGFFYLLNQIKGTSTAMPASCVKMVNEYTLEFPIVSCLGDVLEPDTAYVFYLSQRLEGNTIKTLSSIKGVGVSEKAFGLEYKSILFHTISDLAANVVPSKCSPQFNAIDVSMKPTVRIAFDSIVHLGMGTIELRSMMDHPRSSVTVDVTDSKHVVLGSDHMSLVVYDIHLVGLQKYQVIFNAGVVLSESGSKCGTRDDYFFTVEADNDKPYILFVHPKNYKTNVPKNVVIRVAFSEAVVPNAGVISFTGEKDSIEVNIQSSKEVSCSYDECMIKPSKEFESGVYSMSFGENAFKDLAGNTLVKGVSGHVFTVAEVACGMDYVHVNKEQPCYCQSVGNQCQCQCGETYFVKDY